MPFRLLALPLSAGGSEAVAKYPCGKAAERKKNLLPLLFSCQMGVRATTKLSVNSARGEERGERGVLLYDCRSSGYCPPPPFFRLGHSRGKRAEEEHFPLRSSFSLREIGVGFCCLVGGGRVCGLITGTQKLGKGVGGKKEEVKRRRSNPRRRFFWPFPCAHTSTSDDNERETSLVAFPPPPKQGCGKEREAFFPKKKAKMDIWEIRYASRGNSCLGHALRTRGS